MHAEWCALMNSKTQTRSCRFRVRTRQQLDRFGSVDGIVLRSLTQAVTIPIYGRLADLYGRKRVFLAGAGLFLFASALCGLAWGMHESQPPTRRASVPSRQPE